MMSVLLRVVSLVVFVTLAACSGGSGEGGISGTGGSPNIRVQGIAEKGPFLKRSEVSYKYIDAQGQTISEDFSTETTDNLGNFSLGLSEAGLISIRVEGYHFNELNGQVSDGLLVLKAIFEASDDEDQQAYVNILTHLISDRVLELIQTTDLSTNLAIAQAEQELLSELDSAIPKISINDFSQLSIYNRNGQNNQGNAYLLLLSAALYQHALNNTVSGGSQSGELTKVLNDLADDFVDGDLEASSAILDGLVLAIQQLDPASVITNLKNRSSEVLGQQLEVPDFSQFIGQFIITYPAAESELSDITTIRTEVPSGLRNVTLDLMVDGLVVDSITEAPYEFTWNPYYWSSETPTRHTLLVKARNSLGAEIISNLVPVSVLPSSRDQLSLTSPSNGQSLTNIDQANLMWNALAGTDAYQTQVAAESSFSTTIHDALVNENQYLATNLNVGSYYWRIRAIDDDGNTGNWSDVNRFNIVSPDAPALTSPVNSLAIRDTDKPTLIWENVTNAESYIVQVSQLSDFSEIVQQQVTTSTEWTTMHLDAGNYYWRVKSIDSANHESEFSHAGHFDVTGPLVPVLSLPLNNELFQSTSTVSLSWNAVDYAHSYRIQLSENSDFSVLTSEQVIQTNSFTTEALGIGRYFWRVKGINTHGYEGNYSTARSFNISGPDAPTLQLPSFGSVIRDTNTPVLTWSAVNFAENYIIQISAHNNFSSLVEQKNSLTTNAVTSALSAGNYFWRVKSINSSGHDSAFSEVGAFQIAGPLPPEGITSNWTSNETEYDVTLNWQSAEFATGYDIQIASDSAFTSDLTSLNVSSESAMSTLKLGEYFARVRSINSVGINGTWSEVIDLSVGVFRTQLGGSGDDYAQQFISSINGGYLIRATTKSPAVSATLNGTDDWVIHLSDSGEIVNQFTSSATAGSRFSDIYETSDGSIYLVGYDSNTKGGVVVKLNPDLELIWEKHYRPDIGSETYRFHSLVEWNDDLYMAATQSGTYIFEDMGEWVVAADIYLHTINPENGNISEVISNPAISNIVSYDSPKLLVLNSGNLLISGSGLIDNNGTPNPRPNFSIIDTNLNSVTTWISNGGWSELIFSKSAFLLNNGQFVFGGEADGFFHLIMVFNEDGSFDRGKPISDYQYDNNFASTKNSEVISYEKTSSTSYVGEIAVLHDIEYQTTVATESESVPSYYITQAGIIKNQDNSVTVLLSAKQSTNGNYDIIVKRIPFNYED